MKRVSQRQQDRLDEYFEQADNDAALQRCEVCKEIGSKDHLERHHYKRRLGDNLLEYFYVHPSCHAGIESFGEWAKENGFTIYDNSNEKNFHSLQPGENMLKQRKL